MRLLLADSNQLIRVGLKSTLSGLAEVHSIIEISNGKQLIDLAQQGGMAVVLIDYTAEGFDINDVIASLRLNPSLKFIGLTYLQSPQTLVDALRGGVMSYIKKDCDLQEISDAVIETAKGNKFFCGKILETISKANLDVDDIDATV